MLLLLLLLLMMVNYIEANKRRAKCVFVHEAFVVRDLDVYRLLLPRRQRRHVTLAWPWRDLDLLTLAFDVTLKWPWRDMDLLTSASASSRDLHVSLTCWPWRLTWPWHDLDVTLTCWPRRQRGVVPGEPVQSVWVAHRRPHRRSVYL